MTILVDTREQKADHIIGYFDRKNVNHKKKALNYGDYSFMIPANEKLGIQRDMYFDSKVCVERKGSLEEISGNLSKDRARFEKDIADGNYNTQYNKKSFIGSLHSFWFKYDVPIFFMPDNKYSGLFIRLYFEYYFKNYLKGK